MFKDNDGSTASAISRGFFTLVGIFGCVCAIAGLLTNDLANVLTGAACVIVAFAQGEW